MPCYSLFSCGLLVEHSLGCDLAQSVGLLDPEALDPLAGEVPVDRSARRAANSTSRRAAEAGSPANRQV